MQILNVADDSPERELDIFDSQGLLATIMEHEKIISNLSKSEGKSNSSNPMENPSYSREPRREVRWLDLDAKDYSLKSIGRRFEDRLNRSLLSSSNSLLHHIRSPKDDNLRRNLHQCPGYLREEITLTCDPSKCVILSHAFPAPSERCSICHQLVRYPPTVSDHAEIAIVVANYCANKNLLITGGTFVRHYHHLPEFMPAATKLEQKKKKKNLSVSCLYYCSQPLLMICRLRILAQVSLRTTGI